MTDSFFPENYEMPSTTSGYMKLVDGDNVFRIMTRPIIGYEFWTEDENGKHPNRVHERSEVPKEVWKDKTQKPKEFWAFVIWNYNEDRFQILELTQKTIKEVLKSIFEDVDWGNPVGKDAYDIVVTRSGEALNTEYTVRAKPKKKLNSGIADEFEEFYCNLDALYESTDPFSPPEEDGEETPF